MAITIKTKESIEKMRAAGRILAELDEILHGNIRPGIRINTNRCHIPKESKK